MTPLAALLDRLQAAETGSPELDRMIADLVLTPEKPVRLAGGPAIDIPMWRYPDGSVGTELRFTQSLDAALTLVPEGKSWGVGTIMYDELPPRRAFAANCRREGYIGPETPEVDATAATPALALVIACLRAKEQER